MLLLVVMVMFGVVVGIGGAGVVVSGSDGVDVCSGVDDDAGAVGVGVDDVVVVFIVVVVVVVVVSVVVTRDIIASITSHNI